VVNNSLYKYVMTDLDFTIVLFMSFVYFCFVLFSLPFVVNEA